MFRRLWLSLALSSFFFSTQLRAHNDGDSGGAGPHTVRALSEMNFPWAVQGDGPYTIPPGSSEDSRNASFLVKGDRNRAYTILLPQRGELMNRANPGFPIALFDFRSTPPAGANGLLDARGEQIVYVGATRGEIPRRANSGDHEGDFLLVVVY